MSRHTKDSILKGVIYLCAFLCVAVLFWLIGYVVISGLPHLSFDFLIKDYHPDNTGGIFPMVVTTLYLIGTSLLIATPLGICSAIYLTEYAKQGRLVSIIRFATESLSGIPSIIYGLFGMLFFVTTLKMGFSIMAGAATVSIMILPTIIRTTEEAIKAVPVGYREGSLALGATKLRTLVRVVIPSALPGIVTAVLLSVGRVIGETAAIYLPVGTHYKLPTSVMSSGRTLSVHLYILAKEGISFEMAFATGTVLILTILVINFLTRLVEKKLSVGGR
ncbi:MAG: phosphate ABC transporter permease PstA [Tissierellia bacterium]|nr:phosphate ABC transporter permease PstA [Bacillota bacterium]NLL23307.1 phosphate ABC transporter permease PstA [Tissierellia bacterium]